MQDVIKDLTGVLDLLCVGLGPQSSDIQSSDIQNSDIQNSDIQRPLVIFFDAVGTVFGVRDGVGVQYAKCADRVGVTVSAASLESAFYDSFKAAGPSVFPLASADLIPRLEFEWWRSVVFETFDRVGVMNQFESFNDFFEDLFQYFATAEPWIVYPETVAVLESLQTLGLSIGMVSNFDSRLHSVLRSLSLDHYFQSVTISTEVGSAKPNGKIFTIALSKHSCEAHQAWHVGDSFKDDYTSAIAMGLRGVWVDR